MFVNLLTYLQYLHIFFLLFNCMIVLVQGIYVFISKKIKDCLHFRVFKVTCNVVEQVILHCLGFGI